jgi:hypothetical protein
MKHIWKKIAFFAAANMLALTAQANALDIGQVLSFTSPYPLNVGCIEPELAEQAFRMRHAYGDWQIQKFVDYNSFDFENGRPRGCTILNTRRSAEWKVVKQQRTPGTTAAWFCLESTANFATPIDSNDKTERPCFWTFLRDVDDRRAQ